MNKIPFTIAVLMVSLFSLAQSNNQSINDYIVNRSLDPDGNEIVCIRVPGRPPDNYRAPVASPTESSETLANVPTFTWCFGCSATSAAMMAGYYDNTNYPNIYTGPTNGGVVPMTNAAWGTVTIGGEVRAQCPLSATRQGLDGRTARGHVDDYWIVYGNSGPDPYITNGWAQHTWGDCTADFMGTSQSAYGCTDGETYFFYQLNGTPLYDYSGCEPSQKDGCHGLKQFFESRGYNIQSNYTQLINGYNGNTLGFTFDQYKEEINNGRPVLIQVLGHTMLGYGYDDASQTVYLHDTWDYNNHAMTWGGSYSNMQHYAVTCITLESQNPVVTATPVSLFSSLNVYTLLVPQQTCITYNPQINALMFTARGHTGVLGTGNDICTAVSTNNGTSFSASVSVNPPAEGNNRYPSGAIYNPEGNFTPSNAKKVFVSPITNGSVWSGHNFATNNWDNTAPYSSVAPAFPEGELLLRSGLVVDANGMAHTAGVLLNNSVAHSYLYRGIYVASSSGFTWSPQELTVPFYLSPAGTLMATATANVAFSPDGSVGYAMFIGAVVSGSGPTGIQPILYKTTNSGTTWTLMPALNLYNNAVMSQYITPVQGTSNYIPYFDETDMVVDCYGNLHIIALCRGTASANPDELFNYNTNDKGTLFDVMVSAQGSGSVVRFIETMETDQVTASQSGYGSDAIGWNHRVQASRSEEGKVVIAIWSDTDSQFFGETINLYPDIRGQAYRVSDSHSSPVVDFTNQGSTYGENYFHFVSPVCITNGLNYTIPVTKSDIRTNNDPGQPVYHAYLQGITFELPEENNLVTIGTESNTTNYPYSTLWHDARMQMLITGAELTAAGASAGMVDRLQFNVATVNSSLQVMNGFEIKMKATSQSTLNSFDNAGWTTVYSGTELITATGWNNKDFQVPFYWNGVDNLMIEVCFDNTSYSNHSYVYGTTATNKTWQRLSDGESGCSMTAGTSKATRPNVRIGFDLSYQPVIASFTATPNTGSAPMTVAFSNTSQGNDLAYVWDFGDPASGASNGSTLANPTHTYNANGLYVVTLYATDSVNHSSHTAVIDMVANNSMLLPPVNLQGSLTGNNAQLTWMAPGSSGTAGTSQASPHQRSHFASSLLTEYAPEGSLQHHNTNPGINPSESLMALQFTYNLEAIGGLPGFTGAATDGQYLYATRWSSDTIYKLTLDGNLVEKFFITSVANLRDLAYDGQYFYGGSASNTIYQMDFTNHQLVSTITSPVSVRSTAYDSQHDAFWVNNWDSQLTLVSRVGSVLQTIVTNPPSLYGSAYDAYSPGGPYLWCFTGTQTNGGCQVEALSLATGQLTGQSQSVTSDLGGGIAGGLFIYPGMIPGTITLGGVMQGDSAPNQLFGYDMNPSSTPDTLLGYNLYRDSNLLAYVPKPATTYTDNNLPNGTYLYTVSAVYNNGESALEGPAEIMVGIVNPAPLTEAASAGTTVGGTASVAVTANGFSNITAVSLRLDFDPSLVSYQGYANLNPTLNGALINLVPVSANLSRLMVSWSDITPRTLPTGAALFNLNFILLSTTDAPLVWNNESNLGGDCEYADAVGDPLTDVPTSQFYHNGMVYYQPGYTLSGVYTYDNTAQTPLDNLLVQLMQNQTVVDQVLTDATGAYQFIGVANGTYTLQASTTTKPWSGVNATDAIKIQRHFTGIEPLATPIRVQAADVNLTYTVNATDVIKTKRRFSGLDNYFTRGDWTFAKPITGGDSVMIAGQPVDQPMKGLCVGDVNASNIPTAGKSGGAGLTLVTTGLLEVAAGESVSIPLLFESPMEVGAVSLVIDLPETIATVENVIIESGTPVFAVTGNQLRVAWSELTPIVGQAGHRLLTLEATMAATLQGGSVTTLLATDESELADADGEPIASATLLVPALVANITTGTATPADFVRGVYPNPATKQLTLVLENITGGMLTLDLTDAMGRVVAHKRSELQTNQSQVTLNVSHLAAGTYFLRATIDSKDSVTLKNFNIVIQN